MTDRGLPLEQLFGPMLRGPLRHENNSDNNWAGLTAIASGDATVVVSTALVASGDVIMLTPYSNNISSLDGGIGVQSIVDNTSFNVTKTTSGGAGTGVDVAWWLTKLGT